MPLCAFRDLRIWESGIRLLRGDDHITTQSSLEDTTVGDAWGLIYERVSVKTVSDLMKGAPQDGAKAQNGSLFHCQTAHMTAFAMMPFTAAITGFTPTRSAKPAKPVPQEIP